MDREATTAADRGSRLPAGADRGDLGEPAAADGGPEAGEALEAWGDPAVGRA